MNAKEAAALIGVTEKTVLKWIHDRTLPAMRFGRTWEIDEADLLKLPQVKRVATQEDLLRQQLARYDQTLASINRKLVRMEARLGRLDDRIDGVHQQITECARLLEWVAWRADPTAITVARFAKEHDVTAEDVEGVYEQAVEEPWLAKVGETLVRFVPPHQHRPVVLALKAQGKQPRLCPECAPEERKNRRERDVWPAEKGN